MPVSSDLEVLESFSLGETSTLTVHVMELQVTQNSM
jgi:hypothetical protein